MGGSGGDGGLDIAGGLNLTKGTGAAVTIGIGGFGGGGGSASDVAVNFEGSILTQDKTSSANGLSSGIAAQSIGGGGGYGAINVSGGITLSGRAPAAMA